ncbi:hypothetical protein Q4577_01680 [Marinovum sp. 2_MG-2023]|uniref:hypothetical protein n=1 Tax=unclassified Marinovum TaxID=2647166 RepID=UPI0026E2FB6A|nr:MULTISPECIES: hypothetical protein [unclassified Marinovum]MDO6728709.1 hypothetical protein [Marinovum sp. 2_MG-2023]MDO6777875.1 hypothetical protein [Marinovum sp. 1_MG-2023]
MKRYFLPLIAAASLAACTGTTGKDNPYQDDPEEGEAATPATRDSELVSVVDASSNNVTSATAPGGDTISVRVYALDGTPLANEFTRNEDLDVPGFMAYSAQEDALDRMFVAMSAQSADQSAFATAVSDGGQFGQFSTGTFYQGNGVFSAPAIGPGPGEGQVSYAGAYGGLSGPGLSSTDGAGLIAPDNGTDPALLPGEPYRVSGTVFINANFSDNAVGGTIYDRELINPANGKTIDMEDIDLHVSTIGANGAFGGEAVEDTNTVGSYEGIFVGDGAPYVAGAVTLYDGQEVGVFVLTQCGMDGDSGVCDQVAPN